MNTVGIVLISLIGGLFLALIVAGMAVQIVIGLRVKRSAEELKAVIQKISAETETELAEQLKAVTQVLEAAKSNFQSIREEMRKSQSVTLQETRDTLNSHRAEMDKIISTINGVRFIESAKQIVKATGILWKVSQTLQAAVSAETEVDETEGNERARAWPEARAEEYAPEGTTIYDHTSVVKADRQVEQEEILGAGE